MEIFRIRETTEHSGSKRTQRIIGLAMGVPQFLAEIIPCAGRKVDLRSFSEGIQRYADNDELQPLRIGVDISSWIFKASVGFGSMLGDERHLSNYGRAMISAGDSGEDTQQVINFVSSCTAYVVKRLKALKCSTKGDILVVVDGATPPIKQEEVGARKERQRDAERQRDGTVDARGSADAEEQRLKGFRRAGAGKHYEGVTTSVMEALRKEEIAFLVAPYESDGQLAYLALEGLIDLIVTEDSDLVAYGASPILYKMSESGISDGVPQGIMLRREDLAANQRRINLLDFSSAMMSVMFVAVGSDYCRKLKGIGLVAACNIVRKAFFSGHQDPLERVFQLLFATTWETHLSKEFKSKYRASFLAGLLMFRHPVVFDPVKGCCTVLGFSHGKAGPGEAALLSHSPYARLVHNEERRQQVTGFSKDPIIMILIAEGYVSPRTLNARKGLELPQNVQNQLNAWSLSQGRPLDDTVSKRPEKRSREEPNPIHVEQVQPETVHESLASRPSAQLQEFSNAAKSTRTEEHREANHESNVEIQDTQLLVEPTAETNSRNEEQRDTTSEAVLEIPETQLPEQPNVEITDRPEEQTETNPDPISERRDTQIPEQPEVDIGSRPEEQHVPNPEHVSEKPDAHMPEQTLTETTNRYQEHACPESVVERPQTTVLAQPHTDTASRTETQRATAHASVISSPGNRPIRQAFEMLYDDEEELETQPN